ncbi:MAG TPA: hydantoinase/oxoprolinase family protein [Longimicrobiales bacterium]|nr:hydantoinase/oxoprolinase family protein [Longimicrobiales bacterium]
MSIVAVDTGGTFTDVVYVRDGALHVLKVPSTPDDPARAVVDAIAQLGVRFADLIHGSTVATNALLERKGARVALVTNRGFEDVIEIARQNRPQLYALSGKRLPSLVSREFRFGVAGRLDQHGNEIEAVSESDVAACREKMGDADAIAICLLHSYANNVHEQRAAEILRVLGLPLSISSEILPEYREYARTSTTVVNAYVAPLMSDYLGRIERDTNVERVRVMGSGGGAIPITRAIMEPVHTVLSGPAGGVAGAIRAAQEAGFENIISFDMGGTSTDVSLCPGGPQHTREFTISGVPVAIPVLDIHTVGAGGGSIAWIDAAGALRVGPASSGAWPGPICYGRGGTEITVTDANVWLGRIPRDAHLAGTMALRADLIEGPLTNIATRLNCSLDDAAEGVIAIANTTMEAALRIISVERGFDPVDFTLVAFGGAAGLHAVELAERLGIPRVLIPPHPGALSAFGMLASPLRKAAGRTVLHRSDGGDARLLDVFDELEESVRAAMRAEDCADDTLTVTRLVDARYVGQSYELRVPAENWRERFDHAHGLRYGYADPAAPVEAVTLRVEASAPAPVLPRFAIERPAEERDGPLVIVEYSATTWVPANWSMRCLDSGALLLYPSGR